MATLPGKSGAGSNVADLSSASGNLTPELAQLLGDPQFENFLKTLSKAHKAYGTGGRNDPGMGTVSNNMQTGERRMMIPPKSGREDLTAEQRYKGRPKKGKRGNALSQSLAEQDGEMTYESTNEDPQQLRDEAQLGPGVPIAPMDQRLGRGQEGEAIVRAQAIPTGQRNAATNTMLRKVDEKGLMTPRNVPLGMPDYDLNMGKGGQMPGVDTVAGTEALEQEMQAAVQAFETTGRMPDGSNETVMNFVRLYGKEHPLYKRMAELASGQ